MEIGYIKKQSITEEMEESYLDYAMSVIISRALPDVRDGLKPVHRRILYAMHGMGLSSSSRYRKSATVVGEVLGKYHPHGDMAVYDSMVRMAQNFAMRYPLVDGQGNFGCFTGDTKVRLTDGRSIAFKQLIKESKDGKRNWTFSLNPETKEIEITEIKNPRLTRRKEKIMEVVLDNGEKIRCTLDHRFMLRNGEYKQAKDLKPKESLMPAYFNFKQVKKNYHQRYLSILQPFTGHYEFAHKLADKYNVRFGSDRKVIGLFVLHHKDFNRSNNSPDNIERLTWKEHYKVHLKQAKNLWKERGDEFREKHRTSLIKTFSLVEVRKEISRRSKDLWRDPNYRAKYPVDHFTKMAQKLWENPKVREFHRERAKKQWQDEKFRKRFIDGVINANKRRLRENPDMMKEVTEKAKISLHKNWQDPSYKKRVIKSKILGFVFSLFKKHKKVTPEIYEKERINNGVPKINNALDYFNNFSEILAESKKYNHKVLKVRFLRKRENVYDLTAEPWHNFLLDAGVFVHNSIDNDPPAAQRYTEAKMTKVAGEMLEDIDKETVSWAENYDGTRLEPTVLPAKLPQLLLNGGMGIAVGMSTDIPPHNLTELVEGIVYLIDHPKATVQEICQFVKGPDFPTGGMIFDRNAIIQAYSAGRGPIVSRAKAEIVERTAKGGGHFQIMVTEMTYRTNKAELISKMADLVKDKKITGIKDIRDESDKDGVRIVIDLKSDSQPQKVLNRLYKLTDLQKTYHLNMLALVNGLQPQVLSLKEVLEEFVKHRQEVIVLRTKYDLKQAKERAHILEGLSKALDHIDAVIQTIKKSPDREVAHKNLMSKFKLSDRQATAILEMRLQTLAGLEQKKIKDELEEKRKLIKTLEEILKSPKKVLGIIKKELQELKDKYGDERRTKVFVRPLGKMTDEELIPNEECVVIVTQGGYIKRVNPKDYRTQKRGGKGVVGITPREEDIVGHFLCCSTHDNLLFFTGRGRVFQSRAYEIPEASRVARGSALVNILSLEAREAITAVVPVGQEKDAKYLFMATKNGIIKRTKIEEFSNVRRNGLIAISLKKEDQLKWARLTSGQNQIIFVTAKGQSIRFNEKDARPMGRNAAGVKGIQLKAGDEVVKMDVISVEGQKAKSGYKLLVITENGYGKRTELSSYKIQKRGGMGIKTAKLTSKTGLIIDSWVLKNQEEDLVVISRKGQVIRTKIKDISVLSRSTQGVRIMKMKQGDKAASTACV